MNTALRANEISAKLFTDFILLEGSKWIWCQVYTTALANISILFGYYAGFTIKLVKDINQTRSLFLYWDNLLPKLKNLKDLKKHFLTTGFQKAIKKEYNDLKRRKTFKTVLKEEVGNKQIFLLKWVFKYKFNSNNYLQKLKARLCVHGDL